MPIDELVELLVGESALGNQLGGCTVAGIHKEKVANPHPVDDLVGYFPNFAGSADLLVALANPHLSHETSDASRERVA